MLDNDRRRDLEQLLACADVLVHMAQAGRWDHLRAREARYRRDVEAFFVRPADPHEAPEVAAALRQLIARQDQMTRLANSERDSAYAGVRRLQDGHRAVRAYAAHPAA